ncbi:MAG: acyl-CoA dehydrogenase family protein, partial [Tagaea sp.]
MAIAEQDSILALVGRLGREKFAPRAAKYDREASFPFENYADMREAGVLGLCVPTRFGGMGADFETYCLAAAEMGRWCGATALTFNMHACSALWTGPLADDLEMERHERDELERLRAGHYKRIVEKGASYAQPFSAGSAAAEGKFPVGTIATTNDGGWRVSGTKIFA